MPKVRRGRAERWLAISAALLLSVPFLSRLSLLRTRGFNPDELQHLHGAWCISSGMLPYVDYFDHHTPWLHFFLAYFLRFFDVTREIPDAIDFLFFSRSLMWIFTGLTLALTFWLARMWRGPAVAWLGTLLVANTVMFWSKTIEIRPDVPSSALLVAATAFGLGAARNPRRWRFAASGALLGAAVMFTQKALFAVPGFLGALAWFALDPRAAANRRPKIGPLALAGAGFLAPVVATLGYFTWHGGLREFVELNLLLNLDWRVRLSPFGLIEELVRQNPLLVTMALWGFSKSASTLSDEEGARRGDYWPVLVTASLVAGLFLIPVPHRQYALTFLPLLGLFAGEGLFHVVESLSMSWNVRARRALFGLVPIAMSVYPFVQLRSHFERGNWGTLEELRYVLRNTSPRETLLDGFSGLGVFRPHAWFYYFLHGEVRPMLSERHWSELREGLRTGSIRPKMIFFDRHLRAVPADIASLLEETYAPVGRGPIWTRVGELGGHQGPDRGVRRLAPSDDRPATEPYVLIEDGWHEPEVDDGRSFRRSRGRRSRLLVPVRAPADVTVAITARLEYTKTPVRLELAVNGTAVGETQCTPGWREYAFAVPGRLWARGLNEMILTFSSTPRLDDPGHRGKNTVLAVESVTLDRGV